MRFIRMMKRNTGTREKMWAGHTAPFFVCRKVKPTLWKCKKARKGPFLLGGGAFSARVGQSCLSCHPTPLHPASDLYAQ
ncbi:hypothetical protein DA482_06775 [Pseudomonas fluorescens]|nr:hypothetical protein D0N73_14510 [Pseudomonas fluorescens]TWR48949.1 hypothetical protein FIP59_08815 [Pseudomonas fluorescens]